MATDWPYILGRAWEGTFKPWPMLQKGPTAAASKIFTSQTDTGKALNDPTYGGVMGGGMNPQMMQMMMQDPRMMQMLMQAMGQSGSPTSSQQIGQGFQQGLPQGLGSMLGSGARSAFQTEMPMQGPTQSGVPMGGSAWTPGGWGGQAAGGIGDMFSGLGSWLGGLF